MLFNSFVFPVFLLIVLGLYYCLAHRWQNMLLLVASAVFYAWWDWRFLGLLYFIIAVNYFAGLAIAKYRVAPPDERIEKSARHGLVPGTVNGRGGRIALWTALGASLALLGFFKYFNFFADSAVRTLNAFGFEASPFTLQILLPVGISFFTFQAMAYTIDVYWGRETAQKNFWLFALYVSYFPQLVAGPIERSTHLIPELRKRRVVTAEMFYSACQLILIGYFKKVFIADGVAPMVTRCFTEPELSGLALLCGMYLFALQIYGDFAGYTDIARGVSRLFGIELCLNFRQPYFSANITEFWRRWHISLSSWLRDYLYIPLGGNRKEPMRTYLNNMITMLLGGLWHGANWTFVVWGGLHGLYLAVHKFLLGEKKPREKAPLADIHSYPTKRALFWATIKWGGGGNMHLPPGLLCVDILSSRHHDAGIRLHQPNCSFLSDRTRRLDDHVGLRSILLFLGVLGRFSLCLSEERSPLYAQIPLPHPRFCLRCDDYFNDFYRSLRCPAVHLFSVLMIIVYIQISGCI